MRDLVKEITERLERLGIKECMGVNQATWSPAEKSIILKVVIAGSILDFKVYFLLNS